jgi:hypothetical protein
MTSLSAENLNSFTYPPTCYYNDTTPEGIKFTTELQHFAQKVAYISGLEASGQVTPQVAYKEIKSLWKQLKETKKQLGISDKTDILLNDSLEESSDQ